MDNTSQIECICCDGVFSSQADLNEHLTPLPKKVQKFFEEIERKSSDGISSRPFACSDCFLTFNRKYTFKMHLETVHKMQKSVIDDICKGGPRDASALCPYCRKAFLVGNLATHKKICKSK